MTTEIQFEFLNCEIRVLYFHIYVKYLNSIYLTAFNDIYRFHFIRFSLYNLHLPLFLKFRCQPVSLNLRLTYDKYAHLKSNKIRFIRQVNTVNLVSGEW